jgi:hypothetical protein
MRNDEDNIRQYLPVLRRIIILVAVLTAIPVVMWTVTAFVRSHVGPPRAPALQPMAILPSSAPADTTVAAASDQPPTQSANTAQAAQPQASAYADVKDGGAIPAAADATPTGATPTFKTASVGTPSNAAPDDATPAATGSADDAASPADSAAPNQAPDNGTQLAARPQDSVWPTPSAAAADGLPPGDPISGPVPLPRKRPTSFAMAGNIPLPEPRPEVAGGGTTESTPTAMDWLKKVFHSSTPSQPSDGPDDTARE